MPGERVLQVAVTGATGFIGLELVAALRAQPGVSVRAVVRATSKVLALERILDAPGDSCIVVADLLSSDSVAAAIEGCDVVVHLAAVMDGFVGQGGDACSALAANEGMAIGVACACVQLAQRSSDVSGNGKRVRLVHVSTTEVMGPTSDDGRKASEEESFQPDSAYGRGKLAGERAVWQHADHPLVDVVVLRPTGVYGVGERFFFRELLELCEAGWAVAAPSPCNGKLMLTHVDDVVTAIQASLTSQAAVERTLHICPDEALTYRDVLRTLNKAVGRPGPRLSLSPWVGRLGMRVLGPLVYAGRGRRRFLYHTDSIARTMQMRVYSNDMACTVLDWKPQHEMIGGMSDVVRSEVECGGLVRRGVSPLISGMFSIAAVVLAVRIRNAL